MNEPMAHSAPANDDMGATEQVNPELARRLKTVMMEYDQSVEVSSIASYVMGKMSEAIGVRAPFTEKLKLATYALRQEYPPDERELIKESQQVDVHMGIVAAKMTAVSAWLKDIYAGDARVWDLQPTPIPAMPEDVNEMVMQRVMQYVQEFGVPPDMAVEMMSQLTEVARTHLSEVAQTGSEAMSTYIEDKLNECNFRQEMAAFIEDFSTYPYAVMSGPFITAKRRLMWEKGAAVEKTIEVMTARRVNPINFYWSADATECQNAEYVIEYADIGASQLHDSMESEGFIRPGLEKVLAENYNFTMSSYHSVHLETLQKQTYTTLGGNQRFPVVKYFGAVPAKYLSEHGITVPSPIGTVEIEAWVVGNIVIRLVESPYPCRRRPYQLSSFNKVPGAMVGRGLHDMLKGVERVANAAARNIVKNMSFSAGPIGEVDEGRLADSDASLTSVEPFKLYRVSANMMGDASSPAFRFQTIPSISGELSQVFDKFSAEADRISGLNPLLLGQVDMASASRTASGLSMLIANASKVIKATLGNIDRDVIIPLVHGFYEWVMAYDTVFDQKVDASPYAKGSSHALQRDMQQAKVMELLQIMQPYAQAGIVPPGSVIMLLREIVNGAGFNADTMLPSVDATMMQVQNIISGAGSGGAPTKSPPPSVPQGIMGGGTPQGDGRFIQSPI